MRCAKSFFSIVSIVLFVIPASDLSAQVTGQQALAAANDASTEMKGATDERKAKTSFFSGTMGGGVTQIVRAVFNLANMTAQEKSSCASQIKSMFSMGVAAHEFNNDANTKLQSARVQFALGFWSLVNNNPGAAKTAFDQAKSDAAAAKDNWGSMSFATTIMQAHIDMLKATIDEAIK